MDSNDPIVARLQRDTQRSMEAVLDMVRYRQMIVIETREQIAREIERAHKCGHERDEVSGCKCCDWNWYGVGCSHVADAAIARGGK